MVPSSGSLNEAYHFEGPHNKDCRVLWAVLESPYLGKLRDEAACMRASNHVHAGFEE